MQLRELSDELNERISRLNNENLVQLERVEELKLQAKYAENTVDNLTNEMEL
jgi:cell division septum initiation protein DivIVA